MRGAVLHAWVEKIKEDAGTALKSQSSNGGSCCPVADAEKGLGFAVEFEHRSSDKFDRSKVIDAFAVNIKPPHKVWHRARVLTLLPTEWAWANACLLRSLALRCTVVKRSLGVSVDVDGWAVCEAWRAGIHELTYFLSGHLLSGAFC